MSKAILIMDMPESCGKCPFTAEEPYGSFCTAHDEDCIGIPDTMRGKPDWCPLRQLPERHNEDAQQVGEQWSVFNRGWNECLDVIEMGRANEQSITDPV